MKNSDQLLVGKLVQNLRGAQTQAEFAKRYGRHHNSVSYWERGTPSYPAQLVLDIVQYYSAREVEAFAERVEQALRNLPRHRPTNTSLWDGVQMERAVDALKTELARYKAGEM